MRSDLPTPLPFAAFLFSRRWLICYDGPASTTLLFVVCFQPCATFHFSSHAIIPSSLKIRANHRLCNCREHRRGVMESVVYEQGLCILRRTFLFVSLPALHLQLPTFAAWCFVSRSFKSLRRHSSRPPSSRRRRLKKEAEQERNATDATKKLRCRSLRNVSSRASSENR